VASRAAEAAAILVPEEVEGLAVLWELAEQGLEAVEQAALAYPP